MLQTMVSLIDRGRAIHVQVHDALVDIALAALSAEPVTIEELQAAMTRYVEASVAEFFFAERGEGLAKRSAEGGHMIIDFSAKLLVNDTPIPEMPRLGNVLACDEYTALEEWIPYRIPDDWEMVCESSGWEELAARRRGDLAATWQVDHRQVLYGELAANLIHRWLACVAASEDPARETHEWWLLTPREDLGGRTPREVLLAHREFIDGDVQDQGQAWSVTRRCPPALSSSSYAYRYGGFGSHEIILYHELAAYLLMQCERRLPAGGSVVVPAEIRYIEQAQQEWLHQPQEALYHQSPAAMIARERSRLPAVVPPGHSEEHDDCPICRMMFASGQPMIWQLDNFMLDRSFATSFFETREQWEAAQREWAELDRDFVQRTGERRTSEKERDQPPRVWERSHTNMQFFEEMPPLEACGVMLFSIGGHMGELIQDLKSDGSSADIIGELHGRFDDLRVVLKEQEDVWMIHSTVGSFLEVLQEVTATRTDLRAKCADLADKLDFLCRRYEEHYGQDLEPAV